MRTFKKYFFIVALIVGYGPFASALGLTKGAWSTLQATRQTIDDLKNTQFHERLDQSLTALIGQAAQALSQAGHANEGAQLIQEWKIVEQKTLRSVDYLGDHKPLSDWLAGKYRMLEFILGKSKMQELHLDDIYIINYAIPVVLRPNGNWSRVEYGRHFNPLAGVLTFWSGFGACVVVMNGGSQALKYCDRAAMLLRTYVVSDIAPYLADFVYARAHTRDFRGEFKVTDEDLARRYGPELSRLQY